MTRAASQNEGLISRAVREALSTLVSPALCDQLIARSLETLSLAAIPESGPIVGEWIQGPLREAIEECVGSDAAEIVLMQLGPMAAYAAVAKPKSPTGGSFPAQPPPRKTAFEPDEEDDRETLEARNFERAAEQRVLRAPALSGNNPFEEEARPTGMFAAPAPSDGPTTDPFLSGAREDDLGADSPRKEPDNDVVYTTRPQHDALDYSAKPTHQAAVLTATSDIGALEALRRYLSDSAVVTHIPDLVTLLDTLDTGLREPIVLIDCRRPTVHIASVIALGEDLPKGTAVVLWGADDPTWGQLDRDRFPNSRWVRCSREASTADLGSLCTMLIG